MSAAHRGLGIGGRLVEAAENAARERGCVAMEVTSARSRAESQPFYRSRGYQDRGGQSVRYLKDLVPVRTRTRFPAAP